MPFEPGQSGNPGGRPRALAEVQEAAREHTVAALSVLVEIAMDGDKPPAARVKAAETLLDRAWGKPRQQLEVSGDGENPLAHVMRIELVAGDNGKA